jgi:hypothetical protein
MRFRVIVPLVITAALALTACGGGSPSATSASVATTPVTYEPAGKNPSISARMVCAKEAQAEIAESLGEKDTRVTAPTWKNHVYSCTYIYPNGSYTLSVKELVNLATTDAYFNGLKKQLGSVETLYGLGQFAFVAKNNDIVVQKDYKVLLVDVQKIPAPKDKFRPLMSRSDVALNVASTILGCWSGA